MMSGIFGLPGAGKSLICAYLADRALKGKSLSLGLWSLQQTKTKYYERVFTNFPFPGAYQLNFEELGKYDFSNSLIIIDEIMMFADSRNFRSFDDNLKFFFSQHRKMHIDIIYASQAYDDVDKKIRNLTAQLFYIKKSVDFCYVQPIVAFFRVENGAIHQGYEKGLFVQRDYFYLPKLYKLVDSYQLIGSFSPEKCPELVAWFDDVPEGAAKPSGRRAGTGRDLRKLKSDIKYLQESKVKFRK